MATGNVSSIKEQMSSLYVLWGPREKSFAATPEHKNLIL